MIGLAAAGLGIAGSGSGVVSDTELVAKHQDLKILVMVREAADAEEFQVSLQNATFCALSVKVIIGWVYGAAK